MTDRKLVGIPLTHLDSQPIVAEKEDYVEIQNINYGEDIVFEFDKVGKITAIYS